MQLVAALHGAVGSGTGAVERWWVKVCWLHCTRCCGCEVLLYPTARILVLFRLEGIRVVYSETAEPPEPRKLPWPGQDADTALRPSFPEQDQSSWRSRNGGVALIQCPLPALCKLSPGVQGTQGISQHLLLQGACCVLSLAAAGAELRPQVRCCCCLSTHSLQQETDSGRGALSC